MIAGQRIGPYRVISPLGRGGMGEVFAAVHERMNQPVALKVLTRVEPACAARFIQEARALSQLDHPGVVRVLFFGETPDGVSYLALEQVDGRSLREHLREAPAGLPRARALSLLAQIANAMAAVHQRNIVHRDIKPENVLVTHSGGMENIKIIDFGIARVPPPEQPGSDTLVETGEDGPRWLGTAAYMAPEQCRHTADIGPAADVYALGVVLCELSTGRLPFCASDPIEVAAMHLHAPPNLSGLDVGPLQRLAESMLAKDPAARPSMAKVAKILAGLAGVDDRRRLLTLTGGVAAGAVALTVLGARPWSWQWPERLLRAAARKKNAQTAIAGPEKGVLIRQMRPSGLILIAHMDMQLGSVTPTEMLAALPRVYQTLPLQRVTAPETGAATSGDFATARAVVSTWFQEALQPLLRRYPDYKIVYFGVAPIPLILYLGWLIGPLRPVEVRLRHHVERRFLPWADAPHVVSVLPPAWSRARDERAGDVVVRISTSHPIHEVAARAVVPVALGEVDLRLSAPSEDVFDGESQLSAVAEGWKGIVDEITERFPRVRQIHLFASVQAGLALLLGTQLSRTMHPRIKTYQYNAGEYRPALTINPPEVLSEGNRRNGFSAKVREIPSNDPAH